MELIIIIVVLVYVFKGLKVAADSELHKKPEPVNPWEEVGNQASSSVAKEVAKARTYAEQKLREFEKDVISELNGSKVEKTTPSKKQENVSAMKQIQEGRMEAKYTSIVDRAKKSNDENKVDVTLESLEKEHNHLERVSAAEHHHPEDVIPESMLGNVEDLMVKGFDGNLCFERDFVGEAMDMINRFTVPTDVPDFSEEEVA